MTDDQIAAAAEAVPLDQRAAEIAYRVINAPKAAWPYPHAIVDDVLPRDLFAALRGLTLDDGVLQGRGHIDGIAAAERFRHAVNVTPETVDTDTDLPPLLRYTYKALSHPLSTKMLTRLFARELIDGFGETALPFATTLLMVEDRSGYALLPHTDVPHKAVTLLIYLADDDADPTLGTEIYMPAPGVELQGGYPMRGRFGRSPFVRVKTVPYRPNTALIFPPSKRTFHGVKEVTGGDTTRRLIQFQILIDDPNVRRLDDPQANAAQDDGNR